jgi:hypothetical protein
MDNFDEILNKILELENENKRLNNDLNDLKKQFSERKREIEIILSTRQQIKNDRSMIVFLITFF